MAVIKFKDGFHGTYVVGDQTLLIGHDHIGPYDMTYGALAGCLYATFLGVCKERGLVVKSGDVHVEGRKRETIPMMLEYVKIDAYIESDNDLTALTSAFEEATNRCSMYQTIAQVAKMDWHVHLKKFVCEGVC